MVDLKVDLLNALKQGDNVARDILILEHLEVAYRIAGKFARGNSYLYDDLRSHAVLLLVKAVEQAKTHLVDSDLSSFIAFRIGRRLNRFLRKNKSISYEESDEPSYCEDVKMRVFESLDDIIKDNEILKEILLRRLEGDSFGVIADALGMSQSKVSRLFKGVKRKYFNGLNKRKNQST